MRRGRTEHKEKEKEKQFHREAPHGHLTSAADASWGALLSCATDAGESEVSGTILFSLSRVALPAAGETTAAAGAAIAASTLPPVAGATADVPDISSTNFRNFIHLSRLRTSAIQAQ
jgi:hypothetical protein